MAVTMNYLAFILYFILNCVMFLLSIHLGKLEVVKSVYVDDFVELGKRK